MSRKTENDHDEAARLDREYTGDSVNARTHELKKELNRETEHLQQKYEEPEKPAAEGRKD